MSETDDAADAAFLRDAERELGELMDRVGNTDRRHGPKPRTVDQQRHLLAAQREALRWETHGLLRLINELEDEFLGLAEPCGAAGATDLGARALHRRSRLGRVALEPAGVALGQRGGAEPMGEDREPYGQIDREQDRLLVR